MRSFLRNRRFKNFAFKTDVLCSCLLLNSKGSQIVATGINDLDSPPNAIILRTAVNPVGLPESLGSNGCIVIQQNPNNAFNCQLAFSFGSDKIAIRRKRNSNAWSDWKYFSAE